MHRTVGSTDYYRTISDGLTDYQTNGLMDRLGLGLAVQ